MRGIRSRCVSRTNGWHLSFSREALRLSAYKDKFQVLFPVWSHDPYLQKKDSKDGTDTKEQTSIVRKNIDETDSEKVSFGQRITSKFHDITNKIKGIRGKLADLSGQAGKIKAALTDEHNRNSVSAIWKELKYLLKHSRFRKIDIELNFALWEPSATGQALGILAMFPAIYQYDIGIYPDFEADKTYVKGTFLVKGHIRLVHVLISGIRLLKERDIRNFIKKFFK